MSYPGGSPSRKERGLLAEGWKEDGWKEKGWKGAEGGKRRCVMIGKGEKCKVVVI